VPRPIRSAFYSLPYELVESASFLHFTRMRSRQCASTCSRESHSSIMAQMIAARVKLPADQLDDKPANRKSGIALRPERCPRKASARDADPSSKCQLPDWRRHSSNDPGRPIRSGLCIGSSVDICGFRLIYHFAAHQRQDRYRLRQLLGWHGENILR
jgi:hypothetical protein